MDVSVPAGPAFLDVSLVVRQWFYTNVLEHDHRGTPLDNAEEDVVRFGPLKRDVEPETVAIKRQRGGDILDDEEWRNAGNFRFSHVNFYRRFSRTFPTPASLAARAERSPSRPTLRPWQWANANGIDSRRCGSAPRTYRRPLAQSRATFTDVLGAPLSALGG